MGPTVDASPSSLLYSSLILFPFGPGIHPWFPRWKETRLDPPVWGEGGKKDPLGSEEGERTEGTKEGIRNNEGVAIGVLIGPNAWQHVDGRHRPTERWRTQRRPNRTKAMRRRRKETSKDSVGVRTINGATSKCRSTAMHRSRREEPCFCDQGGQHGSVRSNCTVVWLLDPRSTHDRIETRAFASTTPHEPGAFRRWLPSACVRRLPSSFVPLLPLLLGSSNPRDRFVPLPSLCLSLDSCSLGGAILHPLLLHLEQKRTFQELR